MKFRDRRDFGNCTDDDNCMQDSSVIGGLHVLVWKHLI